MPGQAERAVHPLNIYRAAKLLINRHGAEASGEARVRAMSLRQDGDEQGAAVWQRIQEAVVELQRTMRDPGEAEH
jgi:hypothetical protein